MSERLRRMARVPVLISAGMVVVFAVGAGLFFHFGMPAAGWIWVAFGGWNVFKTAQTVRWYRKFVREHEAKLAEIRQRAKERLAEIERQAAERKRNHEEQLRRHLSPWN